MTEKELQSLNDALFAACKIGDATEVKRSLERGADLESKNEYGFSALAWAAYCGHTETVLAMISHGAQMECKDIGGWSALDRAAANGNTEMALILMDHGADLESKDKNGGSALSLAAWNGQTNTAVVLLGHGANLEYKDNKGRSALAWAAQNGKTETALALMAHGASPCGVLALHEASNFGASIRECLHYPLHQAAALGLAKEFVQLLGLGYDIDQKDGKDMTPMQHAEQNNQEETGLALRSWLARQAANRTIAEIMGAKP